MKYWMLLIAGILVIGGCASTGIDLTQNGSVKVTVVNNKHGQIESASVYQEDDQLIIRGAIRYCTLNHAVIGDHLDISVSDSTGKKEFQRWAPGRSRTRRRTYYYAKLPIKIEKETSIKLAYHMSSHNGEAKVETKPKKAITFIDAE